MLPTLPPLNVTMPDANAVLGAALNNQSPSLDPASAAVRSLHPPETPFSTLMTDAVGTVNKLEGEARSTIDGLMGGSGVDVHQAMIASEKASMALEMTLAVHNKAVQSYQAVMGMQF